MRDKRRYIAYVFSLLGALVALIIAPLQFSEFTEHWFWNQSFRFRGEKEPDPRISIIGIDDASISLLEEAGILYPFPRSMYGKLLDALSDAGARVVIFDILFSTEPWDISEDEAFRDAILRAQEKGTAVILSAGWEVTSGVGGAGEQGQLASLELPTDTLLEANPKIAIVSALTKLSYKNKEMAFVDFERNRYFSQAVQAYREILKDDGKLEEFDKNPEKFGISAVNDFRINYYGPMGSIPTHPIAMMFPEELEEKVWEKGKGEMKQIRTSEFKNGIVFVGSVATVDNDYFWTPYEKLFGVETNAHALNTLLTQDIIRSVDWRVTIGIILLISLVSWVLSVFLRPLISLLAFLAWAMLFEAFLYSMFIYANVLMEFTLSTTSLFTCFFFSLGFRVFAEESEKHRIRATFGRYMAPDVVKEIIDNPRLAELGGIEREVALLFTDIRNYSTISEGLDPHQTVQFLNRFLERASETVMLEGGFVDKFTGDGLMAVFGAPVPLENSCASAVRTALAMVETVHHHWEDFVGDLPIPRFRIGVGIHFGKVVMGNIGSGKRMDYTCIGDVVNVAARIESETKRFLHAVLISEEVHRRLSDSFKCEYLGEAFVKGRKTAVRLYRVMHPASEEITDLSQTFESSGKGGEGASSSGDSQVGVPVPGSPNLL